MARTIENAGFKRFWVFLIAIAIGVTIVRLQNFHCLVHHRFVWELERP